MLLVANEEDRDEANRDERREDFSSGGPEDGTVGRTTAPEGRYRRENSGSARVVLSAAGGAVPFVPPGGWGRDRDSSVDAGLLYADGPAHSGNRRDPEESSGTLLEKRAASLALWVPQEERHDATPCASREMDAFATPLLSTLLSGRPPPVNKSSRAIARIREMKQALRTPSHDHLASASSAPCEPGSPDSTVDVELSTMAEPEGCCADVKDELIAALSAKLHQAAASMHALKSYAYQAITARDARIACLTSQADAADHATSSHGKEALSLPDVESSTVPSGRDPAVVLSEHGNGTPCAPFLRKRRVAHSVSQTQCSSGEAGAGPPEPRDDHEEMATHQKHGDGASAEKDKDEICGGFRRLELPASSNAFIEEPEESSADGKEITKTKFPLVRRLGVEGTRGRCPHPLLLIALPHAAPPYPPPPRLPASCVPGAGGRLMYHMADPSWVTIHRIMHERSAPQVALIAQRGVLLLTPLLTSLSGEGGAGACRTR